MGDFDPFFGIATQIVPGFPSFGASTTERTALVGVVQAFQQSLMVLLLREMKRHLEDAGAFARQGLVEVAQ